MCVKDSNGADEHEVRAKEELRDACDGCASGRKAIHEPECAQVRVWVGREDVM